ncbi:hypothetical protein SAMN02910400_01141 [Lachnospiraceae bacterium C10]|nr:hypothetical protein SAMN02910400_01141 [Lachnospiraceae bacterium C10]
MKRVISFILTMVLVLTMIPLTDVKAKVRRGEQSHRKMQEASFSYTLPQKSSYGSDAVSWSATLSNYSGRGRYGQTPEVRITAQGNRVSGKVSGMLDFEDWEVRLSYRRTYYWQETEAVYGWYKDCGDQSEDHTCSFPACYRYGQTGTQRVTKSASDSGEVYRRGQTQKDPSIYDSHDLMEKVHKYNSLWLANDIEIDGDEGHVIMDGTARKGWLHEPLHQIVLHGNGKHVFYTGDGSYCFQIGGTSEVSVENLSVLAYRGEIREERSVGDEYTARTAEAGGGAFMVGCYPANQADQKDATLYTPGSLTLKSVRANAYSKAVYIANGDLRVEDSYLYGMGKRRVYLAKSGTEGSGICVGDPVAEAKTHCKVTVKDSTVIGRFNGIFLQGEADANVVSSTLRGDCGDCIDQRGRGIVSVEDCRLYGAKGIDCFNDADCDAVMEALTGRDRFQKEIYNKQLGYVKKEKRGSVSIRNSKIQVYTGVFQGNEDLSGVGIQCNGTVDIREGVSIQAARSGAWYKAGAKSTAAGISTVTALDIPEDTKVYGDDYGIKGRREISDLTWGLENKFAEVYQHQPKGQVQQDVRNLVAKYHLTGKGQTLQDVVFDDGGACELNVRGEITSLGIGIYNAYGRLKLLSHAKVRGAECAVKNGTESLTEDKEMVDYAACSYPSCRIAEGEKDIVIASSLQGKALVNHLCARAELGGYFREGERPGVRYGGMDETSGCGKGIVNEGRLVLSCGDFHVEGKVIENKAGGQAMLRAKDERAASYSKEKAALWLSGGEIGIYNCGNLTLGQGVDISDNIRAGVWQKGTFVMLPGAVVEGKGKDANPIFLDVTKKDGKVWRHVIDVYGSLYEPGGKAKAIGCGRIALGEDDRRLGREVICLHSKDGSCNYAEKFATSNDDEQKEKEQVQDTCDQLSGEKGLFALDFEEIDTGDGQGRHRSALRSGRGSYVPDEKVDKSYQPKKDTPQNGRIGTVVLSALFQATYQGNIRTSVDYIKTFTPKPTSYYWREATEFTTDCDHLVSDRTRVIYVKGKEECDITCGFLQKGWSDEEEEVTEEKQEKQLWHKQRLRAIYGEDHTFYSCWDMDIDLEMKGNGQTNDAKDYVIPSFRNGEVLPDNDGPDHRIRPYFEKQIAGRHYDKNAGKDIAACRQYSWQGWSLKKDAVYTDEAVLQKGKPLPPDTMEFFLRALSTGNWRVEKDRCIVTLYSVWDEYPEIQAYDSCIYDRELKDHSEENRKKIMERLLSKERVSAFDREDGPVPQQEIRVYTNLREKRFDLEDFRGMGDLGSASVYYEVEDKWNQSEEIWQKNKSVYVAKVYCLTSDSMDSKMWDDKEKKEKVTESDGSEATEDAAEVFVRRIDSSRRGLLKYSVWNEKAYQKELKQALKVCEGSFEEQKEDALQQRWIFTGEQIALSKKDTKEQELQGLSDQGLVTWQERFASCKVSEGSGLLEDENLSIYCEEGNDSLRIGWDADKEAEETIVTLDGADGSHRSRRIWRKENEEAVTQTIFNDLKPDTSYQMTVAITSYGKKKIGKQAAVTRGINRPKLSVSSLGDGRIRLAFNPDGDASCYRIQRRRRQEGEKKEKEGEWTDIARLDATSCDVTGHCYMAHNAAVYMDLVDNGIYSYRIRGEGEQLGEDGKAVEGEWSEAITQGYISEVKDVRVTPGYRSVRVEWSEVKGSDGYVVAYQRDNGVIYKQRIEAGKRQAVLRNLLDRENLEIRVYATVGDFVSRESEKQKTRTLQLARPQILPESLGYQKDGVYLCMKIDPGTRALRIYRNEGGEAPVLVKEISCRGEEKLFYTDRPKKSGYYTYTLCAIVKEMDQKHLVEVKSKEKSFVFFKPLQLSGGRIRHGRQSVISPPKDEGVMGYVVTYSYAGDEKEHTVSVGTEAESIHLKALKDDIVFWKLQRVYFHNGREYRSIE